eukprot:CAMPEP_0194689320 /NCGR_PEP_ID=MMETSP0295-20121207/17525_1 /TAXON_ID=39354 /ORGANISM="Heterosigma akashiwo, Strain CCMP2393" /LENGTH=434 /DNA_ID=CAMNT_0039578307 /DNA_START=332 /DNA_END=1632 /DNA_ORIENTATION=+
MGRHDNVFRAQAKRGFHFIPPWFKGQWFIDTNVMVMVLDVLVCAWYYVVNFWEFPEEIPAAIRESRWPVNEEKVYEEVLGFTFRDSLFDIPALAVLRAAIMISLWMKWPTKSYPFLLLIFTLYMVVKAYRYQYWIVVETGGVENDYFLGDAALLLALANIFVGCEFVLICLGNYKTRRDLLELEKFRVKEGRCPVCTRPVNECNHTVYMDSMKVINGWNNGIMDCYKEPVESAKICLCCACPCTEGQVAMNVPKGYCFASCCCYGFLGLVCFPFGLHGFVGAYNRGKLRSASKIEGTVFRDWMEHWFCPCCALVQEMNQIRYNQNPPQDHFRTQKQEKPPLEPPPEEMLREELEQDGLGNIAGDLTAGIALKAQQQMLRDDPESKAFQGIRKQQYMDDMKEVIKEVAKEVFDVRDDPFANEGGGAAGGAPGPWR